MNHPFESKFVVQTEIHKVFVKSMQSALAVAKTLKRNGLIKKSTTTVAEFEIVDNQFVVRNVVDRPCIVCGRQHPDNQPFCSAQCYHTHNQ